MKTADITPGQFVFINTFTVEPSQAQALVEQIHRSTEKTMRKIPGFISSTVHLSLDGRHVANYALWRSRQDFESMRTLPDAQAEMKEASALASAVFPVLYQIAHVD